MGKLVINANDLPSAATVQARYRIADSGASFVVLNKVASDFPLTIQGLPTAKYETGVRVICPNGAPSDWVTSISPNTCLVPLAFSVVQSGNNFNVTASLAGAQTKVEVLITDPSGGTAVIVHDFGTNVHSGTFTIAMANPSLYGSYVFAGRGVCDDTATPRVVSDYLPVVTVNVPVPAAPSNNYSVRLGNNTSGICTANAIAVYTNVDVDAIATGTILYADPALTTPIAGFAYVLVIGGATTIYTINNSGVVGAPSGSTC
jgi:hypothetical protein